MTLSDIKPGEFVVLSFEEAAQLVAELAAIDDHKHPAYSSVFKMDLSPALNSSKHGGVFVTVERK